MAGKQQKDGGGLSSGSDYIIAGLAVIVLAIVFWFGVRGQLVWLVGWIRWATLTVVGVAMDGALSTREGMVNVLNEVPGRTMSFHQFYVITDRTGFYARFLWTPIFGAFAVWTLIAGNKLDKYKRELTPESLAKSESVLWPEIIPTIGLALEKGDITKGPWAVAKTEWEFATEHKLVVVTDDDKKLDIAATKKIFAAQLGALWKGPNALPKHAKGIYAALSLCVAGGQKNVNEKDDDPGAGRVECIKRLRQMAKEFGSAGKGSVENLDLSWVDEALARTAGNKMIQAIQRQHAYNFTVLATLLQVSRADGVMPSAMFTWLRPVDRRLWYVLNGVGRYAFFVESAGIMSHWLFEKSLNTKVFTPSVDKAVLGFEEALDEFLQEDEQARLLH